MAAVAFTETALQNVKRGLRESFPDRKSSHLTEALAAALGFRCWTMRPSFAGCSSLTTTASRRTKISSASR